MTGNAYYSYYDPHGAGAQRSDPKSGTYYGDYLGVDSLGHPVYARGPQGDILRINNYVRCVRNVQTGDCNYLIGDISGDNQRNGGDVTYGVRFFKLIGNRPPDSCYLDSTAGYLYVAGDVNGNCEFRGSDITRLVAYFKSTATLSYCHFFPPSPMRENHQSPLILPKD
jgi:hypothetical protein